MRRLLLSGVLLLGGCSVTPFEEESTATPIAPVEVVINSLKCGLAQAIALDEENRTGILGSTAKVHLAVNVVQGTNVSAGTSAEGGIPIFSGASIIPSLSLASSRDRTINSFIDFNITTTDRSTSICQGVAVFQDSGFSSWLKNVARGIVAARAGGPRAQIVGYEYESDFVVKQSASSSLGIVIAPIKVTGSAGYNRSDVQHLKVTLGAVNASVDKSTKKTVVGPGGAPFAARQSAPMSQQWSHGDFGLAPK